MPEGVIVVLVHAYHTLSVYCIGMLSKSLGQTLRIAASMHILFQFLSDASEEAIPDVICDPAIVAAIDFMNCAVNRQHSLLAVGILKKR